MPRIWVCACSFHPPAERFRRRNVSTASLQDRPVTQLGLFQEQNAGPAGLRYQAEFVSKAAENELISRISQLPLQRFQFGAFEGQRRVAWFGYRFDYTANRLADADPVPDWLASVISSIEEFGGLPAASVRQIL